MKPSVWTVLAWLERILLVAAAALPTAFYSGAFSGRGYLWPLFAASAAGGALALLGAHRGWSTRLAMSIALVGFLAFVTFGLLHTTLVAGLPRGQTWTALHTGLVGGWRRLLTTPAPADVTPALLLCPALVAWWSAWGGPWLATRLRSTMLPLLPATVALVVALGLGAPLLRPAPGLALGWALLALSYVLVRSNHPDEQVSTQAADAVGSHLVAEQGRAVLGRMAYGVPVVLLVVTLGAAAAAALPIADGSQRYDVRDLVTPPFRVAPEITPLATVQSQLADKPPRTLFRLSARGSTLDRVRVAALDTFDGSTWSAADDEFRPAGSVLPDDGLVSGSAETHLTVDVVAPENAFLPQCGRPLRLDASGLGFSARSGTLAEAGTTSPGHYQLTCRFRPYTTLSAAAAIGSPAPIHDYLALPTPPRALQQIATQIAQRATSPYDQLLLISTMLKALPYDPDAPPGHSYGAVTRMLVHAKPEDQNGFAEQHASAFVILARLLGIPARVGVGYLVDSKALAAGRQVQVTTADAHAWGEVPFQGYGWVPFETVDLARTAAPRIRSHDVIAAPDTSAGPAQSRPGADQGTAAGTAGQHGLAATVLHGGITSLLAIAVLTLLVAAGVVIEKWRRRMARIRAPTPARQVLGAWSEAKDRLVERGVVPHRSWSPAETTDSAVTALGAPALAIRQLVPLVDVALFAPTPPVQATADRAWEIERQLRADLQQGRRPHRKALTLVDPRPLLNRSVLADLAARRRRDAVSERR
ncbi:transglutaminase-like domain-containing protein [Angustibacter sp. McL0619]|uniref:transglutaminase-like domain-containing protein n=1 Tax=Angustibacter sp. McL0619 TaxID=3415676 RepID=UPI003CF69C73